MQMKLGEIYINQADYGDYFAEEKPLRGDNPLYTAKAPWALLRDLVLSACMPIMLLPLIQLFGSQRTSVARNLYYLCIKRKEHLILTISSDID